MFAQCALIITPWESTLGASTKLEYSICTTRIYAWRCGPQEGGCPRGQNYKPTFYGRGWGGGGVARPRNFIKGEKKTIQLKLCSAI